MATTKKSAAVEIPTVTAMIALPANCGLARFFAALHLNLASETDPLFAMMLEASEGEMEVGFKEKTAIKTIQSVAGEDSESDDDDAPTSKAKKPAKKKPGKKSEDDDSDDEDESNDDEDSDDEDSDDEDSDDEDSDDEDSDDEDSDDDEDSEDEEVDFDSMKDSELKAYIKSEVDPKNEKDFVSTWIVKDKAAGYKSGDAKKKSAALKETAKRISATQEKWANYPADKAQRLAEKAGADTALGRGRKSDELRVKRFAARAVLAGYKP